ncbi:MAG TPA: hypothetical protein VFA29_05815 [Candidatus Baltobacteraceae bacterium]|nr:hypothetical protein [Candidatus Baltobacteraceae bacterium]
MAKPRLAAALAAVFLYAVLSAAFGAQSLAASSGELLSAIKTLPAQTDKLRGMMADLNESQFKLVDVSALADDAAVRAALKKGAADVADMRDTLTHTTLTGNDGVVTSVAKLLGAKDLKISQVVAISVTGSQVTLYYQ